MEKSSFAKIPELKEEVTSVMKSEPFTRFNSSLNNNQNE
jgi:hypothetical protein